MMCGREKKRNREIKKTIPSPITPTRIFSVERSITVKGLLYFLITFSIGMTLMALGWKAFAQRAIKRKNGILQSFVK